MTDALARLSPAQRVNLERAMALSGPSASARELAERVVTLEEKLATQHEQLAAQHEQLAAQHRLIEQQTALLAAGVQELAGKVAALNDIRATAAAALDQLAGLAFVTAEPSTVTPDAGTFARMLGYLGREREGLIHWIGAAHALKVNEVDCLRMVAYAVEQRLISVEQTSTQKAGFAFESSNNCEPQQAARNRNCFAEVDAKLPCDLATLAVVLRYAKAVQIPIHTVPFHGRPATTWRKVDFLEAVAKK